MEEEEDEEEDADDALVDEGEEDEDNVGDALVDGKEEEDEADEASGVVFAAAMLFSGALSLAAAALRFCCAAADALLSRLDEE